MPGTREAPSIDSPPWWSGFLCGCVVVLAVLSAHPFAEMGFIDDWSYIKTAQEYARTGHFVYNGWATAMLGWQVPWSALFIRVFGFSFTVARLPTLVSAFFTIWLFHSILTRCGIHRRNAAFGALMLGLSPVFIPMAASLMTDINGLFIILLCMYMCLRALYARTDRAAFCWLAFAALVNVAGGTVRQNSWLGALVLVPTTAWMMRSRRGALFVGIAAWCLSGLGIYACWRWWQQQPYSVPESVFAKPVALGYFPGYAIKIALCFGLLLFPLLATWFVPIGRFRGRIRAGLIAFAAFTTAWMIVRYKRGLLDGAELPWGIGDLVGAQGIDPRTNWLMLGTLPVSLTTGIRAVISLCVIVSLVVFFADLLANRRLSESLHNDSPHNEANLLAWNDLVTFIAPFSLAYVCLLLPRAFHFYFYDRYFLGLIPIGILLLLNLYQRNVRSQVSLLSYTVLAIFATYSIAATHDWFALNRARIIATNTLAAGGVPAIHIQGGMEINGWTEINTHGFVNEKRVVNPSNAYRSNPPKPKLPPACSFWFDSFTPEISPRYFLVLNPLPCLANSRFDKVAYDTWLPPFRRAVYIQQRPQ